MKIIEVLNQDKVTLSFEVFPPKKMDDYTKVEEAGKKEYIKTYNVVEKINIDDETGEINYYVLKQFQDDNLVIVKIKNTYNLEINQNYEFVLYGEKDEGKTYSQNDIFENFEIKDIRKTDKVGLEQIQDF